MDLPGRDSLVHGQFIARKWFKLPVRFAGDVEMSGRVGRAGAWVVFRIGLILPAIIIAEPALASRGATLVPEPSDFALFLIGVIGLVIGRTTSRAGRRRDDRDA